MIRSMTGFGRAEARTETLSLMAEIRSVNNRNIRVSFRLPERLQGLESELEKRIRKHIVRGSINVAMSLDELAPQSPYSIDTVTVRRYRDELNALAKELGLSDEVTIETLMTLPGVIQKQRTIEDVPEDLMDLLNRTLDEAASALVKTREEEGAAIWKDIVARCEAIGAIVTQVETRVPRMVEEYASRLSERLQKLLERLEAGLKEDDFRREVALFADRSDICEEIVRLRSHVELMQGMGAGEEPCGRRLEFMAQEMFREANTMAAKSNDAAMIQEILDIKGEIEKIREQVMNVE